MADARLVWRELSQAQPNVAPLLAQANNAFNNAADAADGILGRYQKGIEGKNDAEVRQELAAIKDEAGYDKWLASGGLNGRQVSDDVLSLVSGNRDTIIGYTNDRSIVRDRDGRLVIAQNDGRIRQDINARQQGDWDWQDGHRRELAGLSGLVVNARTEGQDWGANGMPSYVRYSNSGAIRNKPLNDQLLQSMSFLGDMGITMDVISGGQDAKGEGSRRTGSERHDHGNAGDVDFYNKEGRKLSWNNPNDLPILQEIVGRARANGVTGIGAADDYMGDGRFHIGFGNEAVWGAGGKSANAPKWLQEAYARSGQYSPSGGGSLPLAVTAQTPARDALEAALAGSQYLSPDQINSLLNTNDGFVQQGVDRQTQERLQRNEDLLAQLTMDAINNPENTTPAQVQQEVAKRAEETGMLSSSEVLAGIKGAEGEIASSPGLQAQLAPTVADDVKANEMIENTVKAATEAINATDTNWMFRDAQSYTGDTALDIANQLASNLNLEQTTSNFEVKDLEQKLRKFASDNDLSIPEAAAAFARGYEADPAWLRGEDTWHGLGWDLTRNTLDNQFDADVIGGLVSGVSQQSRQKYNEARSSVTVMENELRILQSQITLLRRQAAKARTPAQKANFEAQILALETAQGEVESKLSTAKK